MSVKVHFDEIWVQAGDPPPYPTLADVPQSPAKDWINHIGTLLFLPQFSVFPVSYLDDELCVFDFELLGTRVCALKQ